jgi:hypothetical protein
MSSLKMLNITVYFVQNNINNYRYGPKYLILLHLKHFTVDIFLFNIFSTLAET